MWLYFQSCVTQSDFNKRRVFTNPQTARSSSCLLFLCPEILNISTSPHEFKMNSHISAVGGGEARRPGQALFLYPDSLAAQVCFSVPLTAWNDSQA